MAKSVDLGKGSSRFVVLASVCIVTAGLYFAQEVFVPLALAILITFALSPLASRLERFHVSRVPASLIVVGVALGFVGFLAFELSNQVIEVANDLPHYREEIRAKFDRFRGSGSLQKTFNTIENNLTPTSAPTTMPVAMAVGAPAPGAAAASASSGTRGGDAPLPYNDQNPLPVRQVEAATPLKTALEWIGGALHPLTTAGLVVIFVIFMLLNREDLRDRMIRLIGAGQLNTTTQAVSDAADRISSYLLSLSLVNLCYGICVAAGLWIIGKLLGHGQPFPNALFWGLICGVSRFIPYVGVWVAAAVPVALSFGLYPNFGVFVATAGMFIGYEAIVGNFVEPYLYGARTGISTIAVLASAVFWAWLWGPVGLLLSTPLTVILVVIGKYVPQLQFLDIILGDEPVLEPPVRIYQRLLALDAEEAADLARDYLKQRPIEEVFGDIFLPTLALAEHDRHLGNLDAKREKFVRDTMRDLVEELSELNREQLREKAKARDAKDTKDASNPKIPAGAISFERASDDRFYTTLPKGCTVNVVCLPAHDESDEIAGMMLAELLADRGYCATAVSQEKLASEMLQTVEKRNAQIVVISALPPAAVTHARYLCKRLHAKFDNVNMVVGLWTAKGDTTKAKDRITCESAVQLTTTFTEALAQIQQLSQPVLVSAANDAAMEAAPARS